MKECWEAREANQSTSSGQLGKGKVDKTDNKKTLYRAEEKERQNGQGWSKQDWRSKKTLNKAEGTRGHWTRLERQTNNRSAGDPGEGGQGYTSNIS